MRERGETQIGVLLWAVGLGVAVSVIMTLQSCIETYKDGKVRARHEQLHSRYKKGPERGYQGYSVAVR